MPFVGIGLHVLLALFCAVHAVKTGQQMYWVFILFAFPLLGSVVYILAVYLPSSRLERGAVKVVSTAAKVFDPGREVRLARADFDDTPTAQNQMRLAAALLETGDAEEAAKLYESALKGVFASDRDIRYGAARSFVMCHRYQDALPHLEALRRSEPNYRSEGVALLLARSYAGTSRNAEAQEAFKQAVERFGTFEARAEYAIWALTTGDMGLAESLQVEIDNMMRRWNSVSRGLNEPVLRRLKSAQQVAARRA